MIHHFSIHTATVAALVLAAIAAASCTGPVGHPPAGASEPSIRVCIADRTGEVLLETREPMVVHTVGKRQRIEGTGVLRCSLSDSGSIVLKREGQASIEITGAFRCFSQTPGTAIRFEKRDYTDTLLLASDGEHLYLINILPLESYLRGVVPNEIGKNRTDQEKAAVEAQAIIARTYALNKIRLPLTRLFDVYDDVRDQVFAGAKGSDAVCTEAVNSTRGIVVAWDGQPVECYFHSTCGGSTEASTNVWRRPQSRPFLTMVSDRNGPQTYCRISPSFRWTEVYTRKQLEGLLRAFLPSANDALRAEDIPGDNWYLLDINLLKRAPSGRVTTVQIVMGNRSRQRAYYVHADKIRWAFRRPDGNALRSTLFDIHLKRDSNRWITQIRIDGGGNGHGVGMCQWGAIARSRAGYSYEQILRTYFPGTELRAMY